jgi:hypothetical protein
MAPAMNEAATLQPDISIFPSDLRAGARSIDGVNFVKFVGFA